MCNTKNDNDEELDTIELPEMEQVAQVPSEIVEEAEDIVLPEMTQRPQAPRETTVDVSRLFLVKVTSGLLFVVILSALISSIISPIMGGAKSWENTKECISIVLPAVTALSGSVWTFFFRDKGLS
ncbi:MAG: hypothetical protein JXR76_27255 [Deltaproteobacteria bacterium]|nr:hypothetical protein [Deltaproteobacteria bacterium]